jgi:acyl-CoA synthetase (NDP forming)
VLFQSIVPNRSRVTRSAVLFGNGGGTSVLAADAFARRGIDISRIGADAIAALEALRLPPGTSVVNPIDTPAATLRHEEGMIAGRILQIVFELARPDSVVMHVNLPVFLSATDQRSDIVGNLMQAALRVQQSRTSTPHFLLVLRSDGAPATEALKAAAREQARLLGIPTFDEMVNAAGALAAIAAVERFVSARLP